VVCCGWWDPRGVVPSAWCRLVRLMRTTLNRQTETHVEPSRSWGSAERERSAVAFLPPRVVSCSSCRFVFRVCVSFRVVSCFFCFCFFFRFFLAGCVVGGAVGGGGVWCCVMWCGVVWCDLVWCVTKGRGMVQGGPDVARLARGDGECATRFTI
jgi:hypothetical protein